MMSPQKELHELLIKEQNRIKKENKQGFTNRSKHWERIVMRIMNNLHGWNLEDMNDFKPNFPAIDLGDSKNGIGIQVSSVTARSKIKNTIDKMSAKGNNGHSVIQDYPNLYFFFLRFKSKTDNIQRTIEESNCPNAKVFDFSSLEDSFSKLKKDRQEDLLKILQEELIDVPIPQAQVNHKGSFLKGTRKADIKNIDECFKEHNIVYLWGLGGIGKTELAIEWGLKKEKKGKKVFLFHYVGSITDTLLSIDFVGLGRTNSDSHFSIDETDEEEQKKSEFTQRINIIRRFYFDAIIILDNFDRNNPNKTWADICNEEDFKEFCRLPNKILITTRFYVNKPNQSIQVKELTCKDLLLISASYYSPLREEMQCSATNNELQSVFKEIINEAESHTLSVELISKSLEKSEKAPRAFLEQFREKKLEQMHLPKVNAIHRSNSEGYEEKYERLMCHLEILFDMADLHDIAKKVMKYASLLPTSGIPYEHFQKCLSSEEVNELTDTLIERSWLRLTVTKTKVISVHPMISVVCHKIETMSEGDIISFLTLLCDTVDIKKSDSGLFIIVADTIINALCEITDANGKWHHQVGFFKRLVGLNIDADKYLTKAIDLLKEVDNPNKKTLLSWYGDCGKNQLELNHYEVAIKIHEDRLTIYESKPEICDYNILSMIKNDLAIAYSKLAEVKQDKDLFLKAKDKHFEAIEDIRREDTPNQLHISNNYHNIGNVYAKIGKTFRGKEERSYYEDARKNHDKALEIREAISDLPLVFLARSYKALGNDYANLCKNEDAFKFREKAHKLYSKLYSGNHPELGRIKQNYGHTCRITRRYEQAIVLYNDAIIIWKSNLPQRNIELADCYYYLGLCYYESIRKNDSKEKTNENYTEAKTNLLLSIEQYSKIKIHIIQSKNLSRAYNLLGQMYYKRYDETNSTVEPLLKRKYLCDAVHYLKLARDKTEISKEANKRDRKEYINLISTLAKIARLSDDFLLSKEVYAELIEKTEAWFPDDYNRIIDACFFKGQMCRFLHQYEESLEMLNRAKTICENNLPHSNRWNDKICKEIRFTENGWAKYKKI